MVHWKSKPSKIKWSISIIEALNEILLKVIINKIIWQGHIAIILQANIINTIKIPKKKRKNYNYNINRIIYWNCNKKSHYINICIKSKN